MIESVDILIAGSGPVGMLLAHALAELGVDFRIVGEGSRAPDRPIALAHGSRLLLERAGAFARLRATPIATIHVSQRGGFGRTVLSAAEHGLPALGYVVSYLDLCDALAEGLAAEPGRVTQVSPAPQGDALLVELVRADGAVATLRTRLLVLAEGSQRGARLAGPAHPQHDSGERRRDYGQSAVVSMVRTRLPHRNGAWERFGSDGPLALLPSGERLALVWSTTHESARALCALRDTAFLARLSGAFGGRLGEFVGSEGRTAFPVSLRYRRAAPLPRVLAIGNAAQTLHPVAGQGLNLGLRDAWELGRALARAGAGKVPCDPGSSDFARRYLDMRALDRSSSIGFTDALVRTFSRDNALLSLARGAGLAALDAAPPARRFLARRMMFGARAMP